jgi:hypothetical protein
VKERKEAQIVDYQTPSAHRPRTNESHGVPAFVFSVFAAAPLVGVFVWTILNRQNHDWGTRLASIPFVLSSALLSFISLFVSLASIRRPKTRIITSGLALLISAGTLILTMFWARILLALP